MRWVCVLGFVAACDSVLGLEPRDAAPDTPEAPIDASLLWSTPEVDLAIPIGTGDDPTFTEDQLEIYYNDPSGRDFLVRRRASLTAPWSAPEVAMDLVSTLQETTPEISSDGLMMFISSGRAGGAGGLDIMVSTRTSRLDPWAPPMFVTGINSTTDEASATMSSDGTILVFGSKRSGNSDIWISTRTTATDPWGAATQIMSLDSVEANSGPYLTPDGLSIYFGSLRGGDYRLYESHRSSTADPFSPPTKIQEVDQLLPDEDPWVSPDRRHLYFVRQSGTGSAALMHARR